MSPRIALVHATRVSIEPAEAAFADHWPEARLVNLLDDSLFLDRHAAGTVTPALHRRVSGLVRHALDIGVDAVLFTCSAFGPAIEAAAMQADIPVLKPYEAMVAAALDSGRRIGVVANFAGSVDELCGAIRSAAAARGMEIELVSADVPGAETARHAGRREEHDRMVAAAAASLGPCDALVLGQFSMRGAAATIMPLPGQAVLTSADCAAAALRRRLG